MGRMFLGMLHPVPGSAGGVHTWRVEGGEAPHDHAGPGSAEGEKGVPTPVHAWGPLWGLREGMHQVEGKHVPAGGSTQEWGTHKRGPHVEHLQGHHWMEWRRTEDLGVQWCRKGCPILCILAHPPTLLVFNPELLLLGGEETDINRKNRLPCKGSGRRGNPLHPPRPGDLIASVFQGEPLWTPFRFIRCTRGLTVIISLISLFGYLFIPTSMTALPFPYWSKSPRRLTETWRVQSRI